MEAINAVLRRVFDVVMVPLAAMPAWAGVCVIAFLFTIFALIVFKYTSNQSAIDRVKRRIHASLFEIRLFNDDLRSILGATGAILVKHVPIYLAHTLVPLLIMLAPFVFIIGHLQSYYGVGALPAGEPVLVTVKLGPEWLKGDKPAARLIAPDGIRVETPPVWIASHGDPEAGPASPVDPWPELDWRIVPEQPGEYELTFEIAGETHRKSLSVGGEDLRRRSPVRPEPGSFDQVLYPAEPAATGAVRAIRAPHPESITWLLWFLVLSLVFAFAVRKRLGVTF